MNLRPLNSASCQCLAIFAMVLFAFATPVAGQLFPEKSDEEFPEVDLEEKSPHQVYSIFSKAVLKGKCKVATQCLSEKGRQNLIKTSMKARQIVEKLAEGPFPESLSKSEAEKLRKWTDDLAEHFDSFDVGIQVDESRSQQLLKDLPEKKQKEYVAAFLKIYTSKSAPKAFRDRMKTLWFTGRLKAKKRVVETEATASLEGASKAKPVITFSKVDDVWLLDGITE